MRIEKEIVIHDKIWKLEYRSFSDCKFGSTNKFRLGLHMIDDETQSIEFFNVGKYKYVVINNVHNYKTTSAMRDGKLQIIKYFIDNAY